MHGMTDVRLGGACLCRSLALFLIVAALLCVGVGDAYADEAGESTSTAGSEAEADPSSNDADETEASGVERDSQTGRLANSWRYEDGVVGGGASLYSRASGVTWTLSGGTYIFSNGVKDSRAGAVGIDVSYHNGTIDWAKVEKAGVDYAIIRCGYGGDDEDQDDAKFLANVKACQKYDIPFGVYLYSYADTVTRAKSELAHVKRLLKKAGLSPDDLAYPVYYDLEEQQANGKPYASNSTLLKIATAFCEGIEDAGYTAGVYANLNWWNNYLTSSKYDQWERWVAQYNTSCQYKGDYGMWQLTSSGSVSGISGNVDLNLSYRGGLVESAKGVRYQQADGTYLKSAWKEVGDERYYFGSDGYALTGEQTIDGKKYLFNDDGTQVTGWHTFSDGKRSYYSIANGGAAAKGWWTIGGKRYYFSPTTRRAYTGSHTISGKLYYFNSSTGAMFQNRWITWASDGKRSYFGDDGSAVTGWQTIDGECYYFSSSSYRPFRGKNTVSGDLYYFDKTSGVMSKSCWITWSNGKRSYFGSDGKAASGWQTIGGKRYYFSSSSHLPYRGKNVINGNIYYFNSKTGSMYTGWIRWASNGRRSYFQSDGTAAIGTVRIGSVVCTFDASGYLID